METVNGVREAVREIMPYLEQVAEKLGQTAQYLWALQVKQGFIMGIGYLLQYLCWGLFVALFLWLAKKTWGKYQSVVEQNKNLGYWSKEDTMPYEFGGMFGGGLAVAILAMWLVTLPSIHEILTLLFNTEYWALKQVVALLKGAIR